MKRTEKDAARSLREKGYSMNEIVSKLGVAKSSVSLWVRDIELTDSQKNKISRKGRSVDSIEKRRAARLTNEYARRQVVFQSAKESIQEVSQVDLLYLALGLYWGEGSKTSRGAASFSNSDPQIVQVMMKFFREIAHVPENKFRGRILIHSHMKYSKAEKFWSSISGIPLSQFQKISIQQSKASKGKKDSIPLGTFTIAVYDTTLYLKIMGWTEGIYQNLTPKAAHVPCRYLTFL